MDGKISGEKIRFRLLIYPKFQLQLVLVNTVILLGLVGVIIFEVHRSLLYLKKVGLDARLDSNHVYFRFIDFQGTTLYSHLAIAVLLGFVISTLLTLFLSHKLAGPIVRLHTYFEDIAKINTDKSEPVKKLSFRQGDFFSELPSVINSAIESIRR